MWRVSGNLTVQRDWQSWTLKNQPLWRLASILRRASATRATGVQGMKASYRLAIASCALCTGLLLTSTANAAYILFGEGYVPKPHDTYVPADAGVGSIGEHPNITNVYLAQTFKATGRRPESILLGLANNIGVPFRFRLLFTEVEPGFHPGEILWESRDLALPDVLDYHEYSFRIPGSLRFDIGTQYAWILDTYVTRDGINDTAAYFGNIGHDVPPYLDGVQHFADATGLGREADFASTWINSGFDAAFLISYRDDQEGSGAYDFGPCRPRPRRACDDTPP